MPPPFNAGTRKAVEQAGSQPRDDPSRILDPGQPGVKRTDSAALARWDSGGQGITAADAVQERPMQVRPMRKR